MSSTPQAAEYTIECDYDFGPLKAVRKNITMENGKYYMATIELQNMLPYTPLTLKAVEEGKIKIWNPLELEIKYRKNDGDKEIAGSEISLAEGDVVELFGNNDAYAESPYTTDHVTNITVTNLCEIYGNVNSLLDEDDFGEITTIPAPYAFGGLFANNDYDPEENPDYLLVNGAYPIALPATTLTEGCYAGMFKNCNELNIAPDLPAPTLVKNCYAYMFYGCKKLTWVCCLATDINAENCTANWLFDVAESGTLKKAESMGGWTLNSSSGLPVGWSFNE